LGLWLFVAVLLLARTAYLNVKLLSHARKLRPLVDQQILNLLENCKSELKVYVPLSLVVTDRVDSPALLGFIRPRLLLPKRMLEALTTPELRHVFLHELAHLKRLDIFVNWIITFLQIVYWFNPVMWLAFNRMRSDLEIATDELVLSAPKKNESNAYGRTIIKVLELTLRVSPLPGTVGILEDKDYMKRRISRISHHRYVSRRWSPVAAGLLLLLGGTFLTSAKERDHALDILEKFKNAYEQKDLNGLMALFDKQATFAEIGLDGTMLSQLDKAGLEDYYRGNFVYSAKFNYTGVAIHGDTIKYHGAFRSGLFEVVGLYEMEGEGRFVLKNGLIAAATWKESGALKKRRMEVFNEFLNWLKYKRTDDYERLFSNEMFIMHRASGEEVSKLFFEWVAEYVHSPQKKGGIDMSNLPKVKRITLEKQIVAVCKEFFGPYEKAPEYVTEMKNYLSRAGIPYKPHEVLGVYFDNPQEKKPEELRSFQGVVVEKEVEVKPPYFVYTMKKGTEYLYTKVKGNPMEVIPAGYMAIFNYMGLHKIKAGTSGGHQYVTMEEGMVAFEIFLEIDE
jgi:effector-binding domain-containing protein